MPRCRKLLRDKPKTPLASLKGVFFASQLEDALEVILDGRGSPQLICACAWRALELLARDLPDMDPMEFIYKRTLVDALAAALELIEVEFPGACEYLVSGCFACEIEPQTPEEGISDCQHDELPLL